MPKQLLPYRGTTLLAHCLKQAFQSEINNILLVLGAYADDINKVIEHPKNLSVLINSGWKEGMASSIRLGISNLLEKETPPETVLFMTCDQPFVTSAHLNHLYDTHISTGIQVVASRYSNSAGIPALFSKEIFDELLCLEGDAGAKKIIQKEPSRVSYVDCESGEIDIDTPPDWEIFIKGANAH